MFDQVNKFLEQEEYEKAIVLLEVMYKENPDEVEVLGLLLNVLLFVGEAEKALFYATEFLQDNKNLDIMGVLGMILVLQNKLEEAKKVAEDMIKLNPESVEAQTFLINCNFMLNPKDDSGLQELRLMHKKDPYDLIILFYLSLYLKEFGLMTEYNEILVKLKELDYETAEMIESMTLENAISAQVGLSLK